MKATIGSLCLIVLCWFPYSISRPLPRHPVISETFSFTYRGFIETSQGQMLLLVQGKLAQDYEANKDVAEGIWFSNGIQFEKIWQLDRYDINKTYGIEWKGENPRTPCHEQTAYKHIQAMWDWVKYAKYNITEEYEHHKIDIYVYKMNETEQSIGVFHDDPNTPYFYRQISPDFGFKPLTLYFDTFESFIRDAHVFDIPPDCQSL